MMMPMIADGSYGAVSCTRIAVQLHWPSSEIRLPSGELCSLFRWTGQAILLSAAWCFFIQWMGRKSQPLKYVFTFYRQFKRKMRNFQCEQLIWGDSAWECFYTFFCFFRSTTLSAYLRTHMRWGSSNLKHWHCLSYEALKRIFQDGLHIDSFKLPVACSCRISNTRWKIWSK